MNYIGVTLAAVSVILYLFVKPVTITSENQNEENLDDQLIEAESVNPDVVISQPNNQNENENEEIGFLERQSESTKRIVGCVLSIIAGFLYGQFYTPVLYVQQHFNR